MIRLKNILTEQHMDFDSSMKSNDSEAPQDKVIDIKGSEPYYTVIYRHEGKNYKIEFEDYELMDQVDDYAWSGELLGVDQEGGEWAVMCQAVTLGGGDYDWEVDWDTVQYQGKPKPKTDNRNIDIDEKEDLIFDLWDRIIDNGRQGIEKGISDNGVKFDFDTSVVDKSEFKEFRKELETMLAPWRHKVYPGSKDLVVIELYENKMKLKDLIPEQIKPTNDYDIMINYVEYDTNFRNSTLTFNEAEILTPENAEEIILQINDEVEGENIRDDETGEYQYDVTRLDGNIKFDCYIDTKSGQIDLTVTYSDDGMLEDVDINDQVIADKYGITEMDIANKLQ